jgi:hypothetical protein
LQAISDFLNEISCLDGIKSDKEARQNLCANIFQSQEGVLPISENDGATTSSSRIFGTLAKIWATTQPLSHQKGGS